VFAPEKLFRPDTILAGKIGRLSLGQFLMLIVSQVPKIFFIYRCIGNDIQFDEQNFVSLISAS
jgi:hypothetical protein